MLVCFKYICYRNFGEKTPPSIYLENLAHKNRNKQRWAQGLMGYIVFGFGALMTMTSKSNEQVLPFDGKGLAALGVGYGLYLMITSIRNTMPITNIEKKIMK